MSYPRAKPDKAYRKTHRQLRGKRRAKRRLHPWANNQGHTLRAKGKLAATSHDWKTVLTNSQAGVEVHKFQNQGDDLTKSDEMLIDFQMRNGGN